MITVRLKFIFLIACLLLSLWLLVAQVLGNTLILLACLACFVALVTFSAFKGMAIPVFLYFLPFSTLLKLQPGAISIYTIALLIAYFIYFFRNGRRVIISHFLPGVALFVMALIVKTAYGYSINNSFLMFFATIIFIPFIAKELNKNYDFYLLTIFFSLGIILAAITSQYLIIFPTIRHYIATHETTGIIRYSGYYGDPNFYTAHITAALGGILILVLHTSKKLKLLMLVLLATFLVYCGFLSVSKSFILIFACMVLLWLLELMAQRGRISVKLMLAITASVGLLFLLSSTVFTDSIGMIINRFTNWDNLNELTTGRTEIWSRYFQAFDKDPLLFTFGKGFTNILVNDKATHNTLLQIVFQFGIIGLIFLAVWMWIYFRVMLGKIQLRSTALSQMLILAIGAFGPWLAIDMLFFDEFFLMPIYICVGVISLSSSCSDESEEEETQDKISI